jgi:transcriptional regulator with XRE-family HTH domain
VTQNQPPKTVHRVIAQRVKEVRRLHGWSASRLAEEMARVGVAWDRSIVANLENGRRPYVTVEELLTLAAALGVHPVDLVVPPEAADSEPYSVTSEVTAPAATAREWFGGQAFLTDPENPYELAQAIRWLPEGRARELSRRWFTPERQDAMNKAAREYDGIDIGPDPAEEE